MFNEIFDYAQAHDCSDIHLVCGDFPIVRELGQIKRLPHGEINKDTLHTWIRYILNEEQLADYIKGHDVDTSYTDPQGNRYRANIYRQRGLPVVALRLLRNKIPTIDQMGLPEILKDLAKEPRGLVLVTGPTGSGKSTTLAAMIDEINKDQSMHILTLEDPIEYLHSRKKSLINQREIHSDSMGFAQALRSALREDPDVILVGEMRDFETMQLAVTAAETGHLVLSTLHTTGAPSTIDRIIDSFPPHQQAQVRSQLSNVLKGIVSQVLIPRKDCYGRIAAHEILVMTDGISNLIRENKTHQIASSMQLGQRYGMVLLEADLARLVKQGIIDRRVAQDLANIPTLFNRLLGG